MCKVVMADLRGESACLDERRFLLAISGRLSKADRAKTARDAFAAAGQEQYGDGTVTCLCGLDADMPRDERRLRTGVTPRRAWRAAEVFGTHMLAGAGLLPWWG